jgi:hypothetical protein
MEGFFPMWEQCKIGPVPFKYFGVLLENEKDARIE